MRTLKLVVIRAEMQKLGLSDIRTDDMLNVSGVRKGSRGGPTVVFAAHMDTVFTEGTDLKVKRDGDVLRAPGIGDDTSNLMAVLEMFRALGRGGVRTKGDLIFLASTQEPGPTFRIQVVDQPRRLYQHPSPAQTPLSGRNRVVPGLFRVAPLSASTQSRAKPTDCRLGSSEEMTTAR
jgi:hypothetical protein